MLHECRFTLCHPFRSAFNPGPGSPPFRECGRRPRQELGHWSFKFTIALRNRNRSRADSRAAITPDDFPKGHSANDGVVDPGGGEDRNDLATAVRAGWRKPRGIVTEDDPGFGPAENEFRVGCDSQQSDEFHGCGLALRRAVVRLDKLTVADAVDDEIHGGQAAAIDERLLGVGDRKVEMAVEIGWRHGCRVPDFQPAGYGHIIDST